MLVIDILVGQYGRRGPGSRARVRAHGADDAQTETPRTENPSPKFLGDSLFSSNDQIVITYKETYKHYFREIPYGRRNSFPLD